MSRIPALDLLRGLAVVLMVMHHCIDSLVAQPHRTGALYKGLRHVGGVPAPSFMLLAGLAAALVLSRERLRGVSGSARVRSGVKRGLYVLGIAFSFRLFTFVSGGSSLSSWPMLFRVDVLHCMGASLVLVAALCAPARSPRGSVVIALAIAAFFALLAPIANGWFFPWPSALTSNFLVGAGPLVLFPLFPWAAFTAVGFALGEGISLLAQRHDPALLRRRMRPFALVGAAVFFGGWALSALPWSAYPPHDYWKTSPVFVAMRIGIQLALLVGFLELTTREGTGGRLPLLQLLGRHSLLAYMLHLELVYGRLSEPLHKALTIPQALGVAVLLVLVCWAIAKGLEWRAARGKAALAVGAT